MSITFPLSAPSAAPTLASLSTGGLPGLISAIASQNSLPAPALASLTGPWSLADAFVQCESTITTFNIGNPVALADVDLKLESIQAAFSAVALACAEARTLIDANPGVVQVRNGSTYSSVGAGAELVRTWPTVDL